MFGWRWSTNFLMAKKNSVSSFVKIFFATIIWRLRKIWFSQHTQMQPEVATSCFVPDKCGVAWGVSHQRHGNGFHFWKGFLACSLSPLIWIETVRERKLGFNCELPTVYPTHKFGNRKKNSQGRTPSTAKFFCANVTKRFRVFQKHLVFVLNLKIKDRMMDQKNFLLLEEKIAVAAQVFYRLASKTFWALQTHVLQVLNAEILNSESCILTKQKVLPSVWMMMEKVGGERSSTTLDDFSSNNFFVTFSTTFKIMTVKVLCLYHSWSSFRIWWLLLLFPRRFRRHYARWRRWGKFKISCSLAS